jgi:MSHA pilin protein MshA
MRSNMKTKQIGFTLIELVVVIVLLGIVGAVATAQFQDLAGDARNAALDGIAAEIQSGSAINYAKGAASGAYPSVVDDGACAGVADAMLTAGVPTGWTVTGTIDECTAAGEVDSDDCTLTSDDDALVTTVFTVICTQ